VKYRRTIFHAGETGTDSKKRAWTRYTKFLFLHPVGSAGHVVHSGHETSTHSFLCSTGTATDSTKSVPGHVMPNFLFLHPVGSTGHVVHSSMSGM
jgi:hypothetical protein